MLDRAARLSRQRTSYRCGRLSRQTAAEAPSTPQPPWRLMDGRTKIDSQAEWAQAVAARVKMHDLRKRTTLSSAQLESRLQSLQLLLPGLGARMGRMQNSILAELLDDIDRLPSRMVRCGPAEAVRMRA